MATWTIETTNRYNSFQEHEDIIYSVDYSVTEANETDSITVHGLVNLDLSNITSVTAYSSISEDTLVGWVKNILGSDEVAAIENIVSARLAERAYEGTSTGVPWV